MNTTSASPAERDPAGSGPGRILVWDAPVRVFHWLLVLCFAGAYLTAERESWRLVHVTLGYTMAGLVVFRLLWGIVGTRYARFSNFVRGPRAVTAYLRGMLGGRTEHHTGHNPAGAVAIVALLALALAVAGLGWATYEDIGGKWLEEFHEAAANIMLGVVGIHIAGVLLGSWLHRDNLIGAMITGRKTGRPENGVRSAWRSVGILMMVAVLGFWWTQWNSALVGVANAPATVSGKAVTQDRDDD
jgi:cytochrome b